MAEIGLYILVKEEPAHPELHRKILLQISNMQVQPCSLLLSKLGGWLESEQVGLLDHCSTARSSVHNAALNLVECQHVGYEMCISQPNLMPFKFSRAKSPPHGGLEPKGGSSRKTPPQKRSLNWIFSLSNVLFSPPRFNKSDFKRGKTILSWILKARKGKSGGTSWDMGQD